MLLGVVEQLSNLSEPGHFLLELLLGGGRVDVADVKAGTATELALAGVDRRELMRGALDLLQPHHGRVSPESPAEISSSTSSTTYHRFVLGGMHTSPVKTSSSLF